MTSTDSLLTSATLAALRDYLLEHWSPNQDDPSGIAYYTRNVLLEAMCFSELCPLPHYYVREFGRAGMFPRFSLRQCELINELVPSMRWGGVYRIVKCRLVNL